MTSIAQGYKEAAWQEGIELGIQQGMQQGIEKTAKQMLAKGLDTKFISELTGLSREELNNLQVSGQA